MATKKGQSATTEKNKGSKGKGKKPKRALDAAVLSKYLAKYSIEVEAGASAEEMAEALEGHYAVLSEKNELGTTSDGRPAELLACDGCGNSSSELEPECPFCGEQGVEESPAATGADKPAEPKPAKETKASKASVSVDGKPLAKTAKNKKNKGKADKPVEEPKQLKEEPAVEEVDAEVVSTKGDALAVPDGSAEIEVEEEPAGADGEKAGGSEEDLDKAIVNIRRLETEAVGNTWDLGNELWEIYRRRLHLARKGEDGLPKYRKFTSFAEFELGMSWVNAKRLMSIAATFERPKALAMGIKKAHLLVRAKEKADHLPAKEKEKLDAKIEQWVEQAPEVSFSQLEKEVRPEIEGHTRNAIDGSGRGGTRPNSGTGSKTNPVPVPSDSVITTVFEKGPVLIPLFRKGGSVRAKTIAHEPKGWLRLANGVTIEAAVGFDHNGDLQIILKAQREKG